MIDFTYTRQKTKELFNVKLFPQAREITAYYKPTTFNNKNSYVFPILNENHTSPTSIHNRRVKMLRETNKQLKDLSKIAEVDCTLTTYVARHSYATIMKTGGIATNIISQALGHDSEKTTETYLKSFENSIIDDASEVIL